MKTIRLAAVCAFAIVAATANADAAQEYRDARGDAGDAPDLLTVKVANDVVLRTLDFAVAYADGGRETGAIWLDTDRSTATGAPGHGAEYRITWNRSEYELERWNAERASFDVITPESMYGAMLDLDDTEVIFSVFEEDLGWPRDLGVSATVERRGAVDSAPDNGAWRYTLDFSPLRLTVAATTLEPSRPVAGKPFRVALTVMRSDLGEEIPESGVTCKATIGGRTLRGRREARDAVCTWQIPRDARGKLLRAAVHVGFGGATVAKRLTFRVR